MIKTEIVSSEKVYTNGEYDVIKTVTTKTLLKFRLPFKKATEVVYKVMKATMSEYWGKYFEGSNLQDAKRYADRLKLVDSLPEYRVYKDGFEKYLIFVKATSSVKPTLREYAYDDDTGTKYCKLGNSLIPNSFDSLEEAEEAIEKLKEIFKKRNENFKKTSRLELVK